MTTKDRQEREKMARKNAILNAAIECFVENGVEETTIVDVAEKSEFAKGTIFNYFESKRELETAVYVELFMKMDEALAECNRESEGQPADVRLEKLASAYLKFFDVNEHFWSIHQNCHTYIEGSKLSEHSIEDVTEVSGAALGRVVVILKQGMEEGTFYQADLNTLAVSLSAIMEGVWNSSKDEMMMEKFGVESDEIRKQCLKLIMHGLKPRTN